MTIVVESITPAPYDLEVIESQSAVELQVPAPFVAEILETAGTVVEVYSEVPVVETILRGPPGPPGTGTGGGTATKTYLASVDLSGERVIALTPDGAVYADPSDPGEIWSTLAVTTTAAVAGDYVQMVTNEIIDEPTWAWTPGGPVFCGPNGVLTQTAPTRPAASWLRVVGVAVTATRMAVSFQPPIALA